MRQSGGHAESGADEVGLTGTLNTSWSEELPGLQANCVDRDDTVRVLRVRFSLSVDELHQRKRLGRRVTVLQVLKDRATESVPAGKVRNP